VTFVLLFIVLLTLIPALLLLVDEPEVTLCEAVPLSVAWMCIVAAFLLSFFALLVLLWSH
jgi:hypothetical protein